MLYRGYPIEQLAENSNFIAVGYLLLYGELPTNDEFRKFRNTITHHTMANEQMTRFYSGFRRDAHPMAFGDCPSAATRKAKSDYMALSKAINEPTTAVLAIDQLHRLLKMVGKRHLHDEQIPDSSRQLRVVLPTPNWEDFLQLAFCEIRLYGAETFQVARRLRAMINNLMKTFPEWRRPAFRRELELLDRSIEQLYVFPEDRVLARTRDTQGLGGSSSHRMAEQ